MTTMTEMSHRNEQTKKKKRNEQTAQLFISEGNRT